MRISDWSSDVCSSDLGPHSHSHSHSNGMSIAAARDRRVRPTSRGSPYGTLGPDHDLRRLLPEPAVGAPEAPEGAAQHLRRDLLALRLRRAFRMADRKSTRLNSSH